MTTYSICALSMQAGVFQEHIVCLKACCQRVRILQDSWLLVGCGDSEDYLLVCLLQGVLLDQFGVLHDGKQPYPHAIAAVQRLHEAGKQIIVLSNSSRRSGGTIKKLAKLGFKAEWFAGAITSGELAHQYLSSRPTTWWQELGQRCVHFTWSSRGAISLADLNLRVSCFSMLQ
eukprot:GHUV01051750.1.p1 GENE.GHUV01051750.1~~GHUV01051750.1.p1  ORF type:complete len:173 (+),score=37.24 GHUV01051750.1:81-599(+)